MRVADSSAIIASFDANDARRDEMVKAFSDPSPILVPPEVLAETLGVTWRRKGPTEARAILAALKRLRHVRFLTETDHEAISLVFEATRLGWVDSAVIHWCRKAGAKPLSTDRRLNASV